MGRASPGFDLAILDEAGERRVAQRRARAVSAVEAPNPVMYLGILERQPEATADDKFVTGAGRARNGWSVATPRHRGQGGLDLSSSAAPTM